MVIPVASDNGNGLTFQAVGRVTNKELWYELQQLKTSVAVLGANYRNTAAEVERLQRQQADFIRSANENQLEHERILASLKTIGIKVGFWAVVSGAAVSVIWNAFVSPLLAH